MGFDIADAGVVHARGVAVPDYSSLTAWIWGHDVERSTIVVDGVGQDPTVDVTVLAVGDVLAFQNHHHCALTDQGAVGIRVEHPGHSGGSGDSARIAQHA